MFPSFCFIYLNLAQTSFSSSIVGKDGHKHNIQSEIDIAAETATDKDIDEYIGEDPGLDKQIAIGEDIIADMEDNIGTDIGTEAGDDIEQAASTEHNQETDNGVETEEHPLNEKGGNTGNDEDKGEETSKENQEKEEIKPVPNKQSGKTNTTEAETVPKKVETVEALSTVCPITEYFCNPTATDHIGKSSAVNVDLCEEACKEDHECNFFTFFKFRGIPSCYLLKSCKEKKGPCRNPSNCVSGRRTCKKQSVCKKLSLKEGKLARWRCGGVNPYVIDIPAGTVCDTSCPSWTTTAGEEITVMSTCQSNGSWSDPVNYPPGDVSYPSVLATPDKEDMPCRPVTVCKPLNITYNPNDEEGAEFYCSPEFSWSGQPTKIETTTRCYLLCNRMLVATAQCKEGVWTGQPELGFWCDQKMGPVHKWVE